MWHVGKEELRYIEEAIKQGLSGKFNERLEEEFAKKFGTNFAIGVNSATSALHCALAAVGVGPGDEVIVPPLTFAAPAFAALYLGAVPVFADVDPETFTIDPDKVKQKITKRTKAIIPVHLYGLPADMDPILEIARENNLKVIEDAAQCFLGKYKGKIAGTIGDMGIFSFERSKHMTTGNGGMIVTNDESLAEKARKFSILGYSTLTAKQSKISKDLIQRPDFKRHVMVGYNYRLPEICAAMALAQLEKLEMLVKKRQKIAELYTRAVKGCKWLFPQKTPKGYVHSYWTYAMKLDISRVPYETFRRIFLEEGGERFYAAWGIVYLEPIFENMKFKGSSVKYKKGLCPIAEELQPTLIQLKTNFGDMKHAKAQAIALKKTIERLES